jgi:Flp pilus assembly pilin Flp
MKAEGENVVREKLKGFWRRFTDDSAQGMVEYILIIGLIVLFIVVVLIIFRDKLNEFINKVIGWIEGQDVPA